MGNCSPNIYITDLYLEVPNEKGALFGTKYLLYINQGCAEYFIVRTVPGRVQALDLISITSVPNKLIQVHFSDFKLFL